MKKKRKPYIFSLLLILLVIISTSMYGVVAKYVHTETFKSSITISANIAEDVKLVENKAVINADGSYSLNTEEVTTNTYTTMPGVDIPKNPHIVITGKTEIPAFLFIEIVEDAPPTVTYTLADKWISTGLTGLNNGTVYVYSEDSTNATVLNDAFTSDPVYIFEDNTIYVSDSAKQGVSFIINIHGYLLQQYENASATDVFTNVIS